MPKAISDAQWRQYDEQGYLLLGRTLDQPELARLQRRIDEIMLGKIRYDDLLMQLDGGGAYDELPAQTKGFKGPTLEYRKVQGLEVDPLFLEYIQRPLNREICDHHYGAHADISCYRAMFMNKPARKGTVLPWHQDGGTGWGLDRDPLATVWTALDPATIQNGCVQVIPGTHKLGLLSRFGHTISREQEETYCQRDRIVFLELDAGEAVLLHNWLLHCSDVNTTDIPRRAFSVCYMDSRTRNVKDGKGYPVIFRAGALVPRVEAH